MSKSEIIKYQLEKDYQRIRNELPGLLFEVLKDSNLKEDLDFELVFRQDMKTGRCKRGENEIHFGTDNKKMKNLKVARKTLLHEAIHAVGVNHCEKMRSLNFYSQLTRDLFTDKIMEKLGWEPPTEKETRKHSRKRAEQKYKYVAYCSECGNKWYRKRKSKLIKHPEKYHCRECKTRLKSRKLNEK